MLKQLFYFLILCSPATLLAGEPQGYTIKITAKGIPEGSTCLLANYYGDKQYIKDSAKVNTKGEVIFKADVKWDQGVYLFVPPSKRYFDFIMDDVQNFTLEADTIDYIKTMKIKGSEENRIFYEYQNFMSSKQKQIEPLREELKKIKNSKDSTKIIEDKISAIDKEVKEYRSNFVKIHPKTFVAKLMKAMEEIEIPEAPILENGKKDSTFAYRYYKTHFWDNIDFTDERLLRTPIFHPKMKQYMEKLTAQTPDSINVSADILIGKSRVNQEMFKYIVYWLTYNYESSNIMGMDAVFVHMVEKYYVTKEAFWVDSTQLHKITNRAYTLKPLLIGKKAPLINMPDTTGKYISVYDIKAKYTVVIFWDHGCGHCKKEIPKLLEQYNTKLKAKGVQVYAIETENKPKEWKQFIKEHKLNWINVCEPDDYKRAVTKKTYDIYSTPVIYLLDENKIIRAKRIDSEQIFNIVEMLDKEKESKK
ncbi:MAG: redoxin domain-containing protein [Bacteroidia bacterium]|nr:redoxin domain-containing protein [Bacteroidia bacterium]